MRPRPMTMFLLLVALVTAAVAGCSDDGEAVSTASGDGDTGGTTTDGGSGTSSLGGADDGLAIEIGYSGGLVPMEVAFTTMPSITIYDDGRTVTLGPVPEIYPGPAVPPLVSGELTADQLVELEAAAREAGLDEPRDQQDFGSPSIADAPNTDITVVLDGEPIRTSVYALGLDTPSDPGIDEEQAAQRKAVSEFVDVASKLAVEGETGEPFVVDRYRLQAAPYGAGGGDDGVEPNELAWPASVELVQGQCIAVTGDDAAALAEVLPDATALTRWMQDGKAWRLAIRPVLPHEPDCP